MGIIGGIGDFLIEWIPTILGIITIIIAKKSLDYSKRVSLVKESYEPILLNLNSYESVSLVSTKKYNLKYFKDFKTTYLFDALEISDRKLINQIIKQGTEINNLKKSSIPRADETIIDTLNKRFNLLEPENVIGKLYVQEGVILSQNASYFYSDLLTSSLSQSIGSHVVYISLGSWWNPTNEYDEKKFEEKEFEELSDYLYKKAAIKITAADDEGSMIISDELSELESEITAIFKERINYTELQKKNKGFIRNVEKLETLLKNRIKRLLIPNFFIRNLNEKFLRGWKWFYDKL